MKVEDFFEALRNFKLARKPWFSDIVFDQTWLIGRWEIRANMRRANGWMGRFGGGWNISFGFRVGGSTVLIDLFVMSISISRLKAKE